MARFDPFGIEKHHEEVRMSIQDGEPGYAQSMVGDILVSYSLSDGEYPGTMTHAGHISVGIRDMLDEIILDVARDEGIASPQTFDRDHVEWMVKYRRKFNSRNFPKKAKEADLLDKLLAERPDLFRAD